MSQLQIWVETLLLEALFPKLSWIPAECSEFVWQVWAKVSLCVQQQTSYTYFEKLEVRLYNKTCRFLYNCSKIPTEIFSKGTFSVKKWSQP